jgi:biofilm PGA synthesis N-glycosyltransferase PgaC
MSVRIDANAMNVPLSILLAAGAFVLYTLFGYPLMLAVLARRARNPILREWQPRRVSILLPVRNGGDLIRAKLRSILALDYPSDLIEILVASDGSTDDTEAAVREFEDRGVRLFTMPPSGKAAALNTLMEHASGEILFFTDVRQTLAPDSLRNLISNFVEPSIGVVSGELVILDKEGREDARVGLYWQYEKWLRKRLSRIDSLPGATGCIYAMRRELAAPLPSDCLLDDVYLPMLAFFGGHRLVLDETAKAYDTATSHETEFRRKVRTQAGVYQILLSFPQLLGPRNRMWIHFVSHKLARLLLPFALLLIAVTTFWLPKPWAMLALLAQSVFYGAGLADPWLPAWLRRITSPVRTFVTMMAAAFCSSSILFRPATTFWTSPTAASGPLEVQARK